MQMNTTITFELESNIREQLAAICARYNLSSKREDFHTTWKCLTR